MERQLFLRSRLELRRAVHSEDHVKEFLTHYTRLAIGTAEHTRLKREVAYLKSELAHEKKLWEFQKQVRENRFSRQFSLKAGSSEQFDKHMVLAALLKAEQAD